MIEYERGKDSREADELQLGIEQGRLENSLSVAEPAYVKNSDGTFQMTSLEIRHSKYGKLASVDEAGNTTFYAPDGTAYTDDTYRYKTRESIYGQ